MFGCGRFDEERWLRFVDGSLPSTEAEEMDRHMRGCPACASDFYELKKQVAIMTKAKPKVSKPKEKVFSLIWEGFWKAVKGFSLEPAPAFRSKPHQTRPHKAVLDEEGIKMEVIPPEGTINQKWKLRIIPEKEFHKLIVKFNGKFLRMIAPFNRTVEIEHFESGEYEIQADYKKFKIQTKKVI